MNPAIVVAPSLLSADFTQLSEEIARMQEAGADWLHIDVMDGHFVPNLTLGPLIVEAIRKKSRLPLDVHLMIENPLKYVESFQNAGADSMTVHIETCEREVERVIEKVRSLKRKIGIAYRPKTPLPSSIGNSYVQKVDMVLLMTVEPGFAGQAFIPEVIPKIKKLRSEYEGDIEVDGGITGETVKAVVKAGANILVSGTYLFKSKNPKETVALLRRGGCQ
jgi:ribulose-phosphate 3-epimerase